MKIIDHKGRLFGKVNIIDFFIIAFCFFLLPASYFVYKVFTKNPEKIPTQEIELEINCKFIELNPNIVNDISVGDVVIDRKENKIGEVVWIGNSEQYGYKINLGSKDDVQLIKDPLLKELPVRLKLKLEKRDSICYFQNIQLVINSPFTIKTDKYSAKVILVSSGKEKLATTKIKLLGISPEITDMIKVGDTEKDSDGRVVASLKEIISNRPSEMSALKLEENKLAFVFVNDPTRNDLLVSLDMLCIERNGELYFKNNVVKAGNQIKFTSDLYTVWGIIVALETK